jgi:hypothetical protein
MFIIPFLSNRALVDISHIILVEQISKFNSSLYFPKEN